MRKGRLYTVSGPSGVGKGTICKALAELPNVRLSISCTTRCPREGERDGCEYYFVTEEAFVQMIEADAFLEYAGVFGKRYGTPSRAVDDLLNHGLDVILEIDVQGGMHVMEKRPETIGIFILPPDYVTLKSRLFGRSTETNEQLELRLGTAEREIECAWNYDYVLVNDRIDDAIDSVKAIIIAERLKTEANRDLVDDIIKTFRR